MSSVPLWLTIITYHTKGAFHHIDQGYWSLGIVEIKTSGGKSSVENLGLKVESEAELNGPRSATQRVAAVTLNRGYGPDILA